MTKKLLQRLAAVLVLTACTFSGGCVQAARDGLTNGVTTGVSAVVVQLISEGIANANK